jgi:hypothetical protein
LARQQLQLCNLLQDHLEDATMQRSHCCLVQPSGRTHLDLGCTWWWWAEHCYCFIGRVGVCAVGEVAWRWVLRESLKWSLNRCGDFCFLRSSVQKHRYEIRRPFGAVSAASTEYRSASSTPARTRRVHPLSKSAHFEGNAQY